jgi:uncharacterized CHY-type Zn-finger protein
MTTLQEIQTLIQKGAYRRPTFLYVTLAIGVLVGPGLLAVAAVPSLRAAVTPQETNPATLTIFGAGMTVLLGLTLAEQLGKMRKNRRLLVIFGAHPHRMTKVYKKTYDNGTTRLRFKASDENRATLYLDTAEARRLLTLLTQTPVVFCPYCVTPIEETTQRCSRCGQDVTRDAPQEMTFSDYRTDEKKACRHCETPLHILAVRCWACGKKQ